jgi:hypothetical protein
MFNILQVTSDQVIHAYHVKAFFDKAVAKMRSEEACSTGD